MLLALPATAATITVDGSTCTLEDAITAANNDAAAGGCSAGSGSDVLDLTGDITVASAVPGITSTIMVQGNGFTIDRSVNQRLFLLDDNNADLTLDDVVLDGSGTSVDDGSAIRSQNSSAVLVIQGGTVIRDFTGDRGAIYFQDGSLTVDNSTLENNVATTEGGGALRMTGGTGIIRNGSLLQFNQSSNTDAGGEGGAITVDDASLTIDDSTVTGNISARTDSNDGGGGIYTFPGSTLTIQNDSVISRNVAANRGGGIYSRDTLIITDSTITENGFTGNQRGGGIYANTGTLTISDSTVSNHALASGSAGSSDAQRGGGIYVNNATMSLTDTVVTGNAAEDGGGLYINEPSDLTRATVSSNISSDDGAGLYINDPTTIQESTISGNASASVGGGVYANDDFDLINSTISGNTASSSATGIRVNGGTTTINHATIVGTITGSVTMTNSIVVGSTGTVTGSDNSITASAPTGFDATLQNNGGTTATHAIDATAVTLVDHADDTVADSGIAIDQRGITRVNPDIGAYELVAVSTDLSVTKTDGVTSALAGSTLNYTITVSNSGSDVTNITVSDTFDPSVFNVAGVSWSCSITSGSGSCVTANGTGNLSATLDLDDGATATYSVTAPTLTGASGTILNTATASGHVDSNPGDESASDNDTVLTQVGDLAITKTDGVTTASSGITLTYIIAVSNPGSIDVTGARVTDSLNPAFISLGGVSWTCAITSGVGACENASGTGNISETVDLDSGAVATYTVVAPLRDGVDGILSNTASVLAPVGFTDSVPGNNSALDQTLVGDSAFVQTYYVPIEEDFVFEWADDLSNGALTIDTDIEGIVSITISGDNTQIYYDHVEDGYEVDLANPSQSTTEIWGDGNPANGAPPGYPSDVLTAGSVIRLQNLVATPRGTTPILFDGADKFGVTDNVAVTRALWPEFVYSGGPVTGTVVAGATEVFSTDIWGTDFLVPAGDDITANDMFQYTALSIMSGNDGTLVSLDLNDDGDFADAGEFQNTVLDEGESLYVEDVPTGAHLVSSLPLQVDAMTGDIDVYFEGRWYALIPTNRWSDSYFAPVGTTKAANPSAVVLYNPTASPLSISVETQSGVKPAIVVPAGGTATYTMPTGEAAQFTAGENFFALSVTDFDGTTHDWGHALQPESLLTSTLLVGWAPGGWDSSTGLPDPTANHSPVWVTALANTTLRVDYDSDPTTGALIDINGNRYDADVAIQRLESVTLRDTGDNDQTGMRIYTTDGTALSGAWGQDPSTAPPAEPSLDLGTTVLSFASVQADKQATLVGDFNGNGLVEPGEVLRYTIELTNVGIVPLTGVIVEDVLDVNTTYVNSTTKIDTVPQADNANPTTLFPLDEGGLSISLIPVDGTVTIEYDVAINDPFPLSATTVRNEASVTHGTEVVLSAEVTPVVQPSLAVTKTSSAGGSAVFPGDPITYTITITNTGSNPQSGFTVHDPLPVGTSYVPESTSVSGPTGIQVRDEFGSVSYGNNDGLDNWLGNWVEVDGAGAGPSAGNVVITGNRLQLDDNPDTGGQPSLARAADISGCSIAHLSFDWQTGAGVDTSDSVVLEISTSGTGGSYTTLEDFTGISGAVSDSRNYDISSSISANTAVRFRVNNFYGGGSETFTVDDIEVLATGCATATLDNIPGGVNPDLVNGQSPSLLTAADAFTLAASESLTVTYQVQVDDPLDHNIVQIVNLALVTSTSVPEPASAAVADPVRDTGVIGDRVWLDTDGDGIQDVGEAGLSGVTVILEDLGGTPLATAITDGNGNYLFAFLSAGDYRVRVDEGTLPGGAGDLVLSPGSSNPSTSRTITLSEQFHNVDFGYRPSSGTSVVGDFLWSDNNDDGLQDPGEVGIGGVTIDLIDAATSTVVASTVTDPSGQYLFAGVAPGEYRVKVTDSGGVLTGYSATTGPQSIGSSTSAPFTAVANAVKADLDFGYRNANLSTIEDRVWLDVDGNGIQDLVSEPGIAGVTINLLDNLGNIIGTTTSDSSGSFSFSGVTDGSYTIEVTDTSNQLAGHTGTTLPAAARQLAVTVAGGPTTVSGVNFGFNVPGEVGDRVWLDADGDGVEDPGEMGLAGVTVELRDATGTIVIDTTTTDAFGSYLFTNVAPASYLVVIPSPPAGYTQTGDPDAALDSQSPATLSVGESNLDMDFGYDNTGANPLFSISGSVFEDPDEDGVEDIGEPPLAGITIDLLDATGAVAATTVTDVNGDYSFPAVPDGDWQVTITDTAGLLDGYHLTNGLDLVDVTMAGADVIDVDFGYNRDASSASIGDTIWFDANRDGVRNGSESGLGGVTVELYEDTDGDGVRSGGDTLVATRVSLPDGSYLFPGLAAGTYFADPVEGTLPAGLAATTGTGPDSGLINLSAGEAYDEADFGYAPSVGVAIGDLLFYDADSDGIHDSGEIGLPGVDVTVTGPGGFNQTVTTAADGSYLVTGLTVAGTYNVSVATGTLPPGLNPTPTTFGASSVNFSVTMSSDVLYADFGFEDAGTNFGSVGDLVYMDMDGDGSQDPGEPGLVGVTMALLDSLGNTIATTVTAADGSYSFHGLPAGDYRVEVTDQSAILLGLNLSTTGVTGTNPSSLLTLSAGEVRDDIDFGYAPSGGVGTVGTIVWHDIDGDGYFDSDEPGIEGVTFSLWLDNNSNAAIDLGIDNLVRSDTSDVNGAYLFTAVPFGDYLVELTDVVPVLTDFSQTYGVPRLNNHSQVNPYPVTLDASRASRAPSDFTADFGFEADNPFAISGVVFFDDNANGNLEPPDSGVGGATIYLFRDLDGDGVLDAGEPSFGTTTSALDGSYSFPNLPDGSDWILASDVAGTALAGATQTTQTLTAGVEPASIAGADVPNQDFGYTTPPTLALVVRFDGYDVGGTVQVEWETASEIGTVGFFVYRFDQTIADWVLVNEDMVPALTDAPRGAIYRLIDDGAVAGGLTTYALVEVEVGGGARTHGPYEVSARDRSRAPGASGTAVAKGLTSFEQERLTMLAQELARGAGAGANTRGPDTAVPAARVPVLEDGIHYLSTESLASLFDVLPAKIAARIRSGRLRITNRGQSVSWWARDELGLYFYGQASDDLFTASNPYFVELRDGSQARVLTVPKTPPVATTGYLDSEHFENDVFAATAASRDPSRDFWFWSALQADHPTIGTRSFSFELPDLLPTGTATLAVEVFGATSTLSNPDHSLLFRINGVEVGSDSWDGHGPHSIVFDFSGSPLESGTNTLEITAELAPGAPFSVVYLNSFDVSYRRAHLAAQDRLLLRPEGHPVVTVSGFTSSDIQVLDVTDARDPILVDAPAVDSPQAGSYRATFPAGFGERDYFAASSSAVVLATPEPSMRTGIRNPSSGADYLILTPDHLATAAQRLADHRSSDGLATRVVSLREIYDTFGYGFESPHAIKDFLAFAYQSWSVAPRFVVLLGKGSFDYKDVRGTGTNLLPPLMVTTPKGLYASDTSLADVIGNDGVPELAIGRLPVLTSQEVYDYVEKLERYENGGSSAGSDRITLAADDTDAAGPFKANSEILTGLLPSSYEVQRIYLDDETLADARSSLLSALENGSMLVNYVGHGGLDRFAAEGLLTTTDVAGLSSQGQLPIVASATCAIGRFEVPGFTSLGGALTLGVDRGAMAVFAPSGLSFNSAAATLDQLLIDALFDPELETIGDVVRRTLEEYSQNGDFQDMIRIYNLLGDPALRLGERSSGGQGTTIFADGFELGGTGAWTLER